MAATVWKGHLTFGLISIPVRLIRAARAQRVPLRQLYRPRHTAQSNADEKFEEALPPSTLTAKHDAFVESQDLERTRDDGVPETTSPAVPVKRVYQQVNRDENINDADLVKGFESSKGQYVVFDEQELRQITPKTSTEMEIVEFVRFNEIDPIYLETSYYVVPEQTGEKAYALLFEAMRGAGHAAIASVSMHRRDHVMIVRAGKSGLIAHTMYYADEVRTIEEFRTDTSLASAKELELANALIQALAKPFEPNQFKNQFREQLTQLIASRAAQSEITPVETPKAGKVVDIMDALRRSLTEVKSAERLSQVPPAPPPRKPARAEQPANRSSKRPRKTG
jgi:DNA end-binding protein Ku